MNRQGLNFGWIRAWAMTRFGSSPLKVCPQGLYRFAHGRDRCLVTTCQAPILRSKITPNPFVQPPGSRPVQSLAVSPAQQLAASCKVCHGPVLGCLLQSTNPSVPASRVIFADVNPSIRQSINPGCIASLWTSITLIDKVYMVHLKCYLIASTTLSYLDWHASQFPPSSLFADSLPITGPPFRSRQLFRTPTSNIQHPSLHTHSRSLDADRLPPGPTSADTHHRLPMSSPTAPPPNWPALLHTTNTIPAVSSRVCRLAHGMPINPTLPHTTRLLDLPIASCYAEPVPRCTQWSETIRHC